MSFSSVSFSKQIVKNRNRKHVWVSAVSSSYISDFSGASILLDFTGSNEHKITMDLT